MSEKAHSTILLIFGLIGVLGTIGTQVLGVGEIKGTVMSMLHAHEKKFELQDHRFEQQDSKINAATLQIERIKGRVGLTSANPTDNATAANPPCTETQNEQQ
jgi:hypothetical protein